MPDLMDGFAAWLGSSRQVPAAIPARDHAKSASPMVYTPTQAKQPRGAAQHFSV